MRLIMLAALAAAAIQFLNPVDAGAQTLPEGAGRASVEAVCSSCHGVELIHRSSGYSWGDWDALTAAMIDLPGQIGTLRCRREGASTPSS